MAKLKIQLIQSNFDRFIRNNHGLFLTYGIRYQDMEVIREALKLLQTVQEQQLTLMSAHNQFKVENGRTWVEGYKFTVGENNEPTKL